VKIEAASSKYNHYTMAQPYIDAVNQLNEALKPFGLETFGLRHICRGVDRWSKFITTGEERDLEGQLAYISFTRKISDELDLDFGAYFPRFEYAAFQVKRLYLMEYGKRVFDGMRNRGRDESPVGWLLSPEEMAVFVKWYDDIRLGEPEPAVFPPPIKNECF
jgi:hypothetical protein